MNTFNDDMETFVIDEEDCSPSVEMVLSALFNLKMKHFHLNNNDIIIDTDIRFGGSQFVFKKVIV